MLTNFTVTKPRKANYTPASLIYEWAKTNGRRAGSDHYGGTLLILGGIAFKYDHWKLTDNGDGTEAVTVYLVAV